MLDLKFKAAMLSKIRTLWLKIGRSLYDEKTGFMLNKLTLRISDEEAAEDFAQQRFNQFDKFYWAAVPFSLLSLVVYFVN